MPALRKFTFITATEKLGVIEETAVGSVWLGLMGEPGHVLLKPVHLRKLIEVLQFVEWHGRLPEEISQGVIPQ